MSLAQNTHSGTPSKRSFDGGAADQTGGYECVYASRQQLLSVTGLQLVRFRSPLALVTVADDPCVTAMTLPGFQRSTLSAAEADDRLHDGDV